MDYIRGFGGIIALVAIAFLFSVNKKNVNWRLVITAIGLQLIFAVALLKVPFINTGFQHVSKIFVKLLSFTKEGSTFLFGNLITELDSFGFIFAFQVLPTVLFFAALTSVLFYLGILQRIIYVFAWVMVKTMKLSGAESMSAAANVFIGQTEAPLLVKPYLKEMSKSEMLCLMTGGMATVAGGVLAAYVGFLGGGDPVQEQIYATHLLTASIMNAPAGIAMAKISFPETQEHNVNRALTISKDKIGSNVLDALTLGILDGLKLAVNVGAMLLAFIAMIALLNFMILKGVGSWTGLNDYIIEATNGKYEGFSLQFILGLIFSPIAWLMGVPTVDMTLIGQLLGEKIILNEFYAYVSLGKMKATEALSSQKSIIIATYALCGFANFSSIGIQIGGISSLAPSQRTTLSALGLRALLAGTLACLLTGTIAGMIV